MMVMSILMRTGKLPWRDISPKSPQKRQVGRNSRQERRPIGA